MEKKSYINFEMDGLFFTDKTCCRVARFIIPLACIEHLHTVYFFWRVVHIVRIPGVPVSEGDWGPRVPPHKHALCLDVVPAGPSRTEVLVNAVWKVLKHISW